MARNGKTTEIEILRCRPERDSEPRAQVRSATRGMQMSARGAL